MLDAILTKVLWNRMISIVDEASTGLVRSCYSINLRDYNDYCIGIFDTKGNMLVHSTETTPGFIGIMPEVMKNFLDAHPVDSFREGDVLATNDPWLATGHLPDISIAQPIFHDGRVIGFAVCVAHHLDIGGRMACIDSRDMYEEGLKIPIVKLYDAGKRNDLVFEFLRANVRVSHQVIGDVNAQLVAAEMCAAGVLRMIAEYGFKDLDLLAATIMDLGEKSMRQQIRALPNGTYSNSVLLSPLKNGTDPIRINVNIIVEDEELTVDYTGSNEEVELAVNVCLSMTVSYSNYPIKVALDPLVPNNAGCLAPIKVIAPPGLLNCSPPAPTWGRAMITHNLPELIFGALADAMPDRVVASAGSTPLHMLYFNGRNRDGTDFIALSSHMGGFGAGAETDGHSTMSFPYNIASIPVEAVENEACILYESKELALDTAGPGRHRGGLGQEVVITVPEDPDHAPVKPLATIIRGADRSPDSPNPIHGRHGGKPGRGTSFSHNGREVPFNTGFQFKPGERVRLVVPGGGGFGDPLERDPQAVLADVRAGLVSEQGARDDYGVILDADLAAVDAEATGKLRAERQAAA